MNIIKFTNLEGVFITVFTIVALHDLAVDTETEYVVADLIVVGYGSSFGLSGLLVTTAFHDVQGRVAKVQTTGRCFLPLAGRSLPAPLCKPSQHDGSH